MRRLRLAPLAVALLLLTGCGASTVNATPTTTSSTTPVPSEKPAAQTHLVAGLDQVELIAGTETKNASYQNAKGLLALLESATGTLPTPEALADAPGYETNYVKYVWDGLSVIVDADLTGAASMTITGTEAQGVPIELESGVQVGATRADLIEAGAWALTPDEEPASAEQLGLGKQEVAGTESLTHPGEVGSLYALLILDQDSLTKIMVPSNDFSDL